MARTSRGLWLACLLWMATAARAGGTSNDSLLTITLQPDRIDVGTFYSGTKVLVSAEIPTCDGAVIVLRGMDEEVKLNRKGRVAGIWLNVAQITVSNVPQVYILAASDDLGKICAPEVQQQLGLGSEFLRKQVKFVCDKPLQGSEADEFLTLKKHDGTYVMDAEIRLTSIGWKKLEMSAVLPILSTVAPGTYEVTLYCFHNGSPMQRGVARLSIQRVGLVRLMTTLAQKHAAVYGVLAIVIAMTVGTGMGIIFNSRPRAGR